MDIKRAYKHALDDSGLTTTEVARRLGISRQALYGRLDRNASFENIASIWKAMGYEFYIAGPDKKAKKFESQ